MHNFDIDRSASFQIIKPGIGHHEYLTQTTTISLKTSRYDCMEDNTMQKKDCIDEFIAEKIHCRLPWMKNKDENSRICQSKKDLKAFRTVSYFITSPKMKIVKECFKPNCKQTTWVKNQYQYVSDKKDDGINDAWLLLFIPSTAKVIQRKEIKLADFGTFMADCGSYLGLFLGASVLSLTDWLVIYTKQVFRTLYGKFYNH